MTERIHTPPRAARRVLAVAVSLAALAVLAIPALQTPSASAADLTFPYDNAFDTGQGGVLSGDARIVDGRLRLTDDSRGQAGSWSTADTFPSTLGLDIEFEYAMYSDDPRAGADGLLVYLADGAAEPGIGGTGAALGYACRPESTQGQGPCDTAGIPGGFAAIALDRYGNFSLPINDSGPGVTPDAVVVRGSGDGTDGYRFVANAVAPGRVETDGPTTRTVRVQLLPGDDGELAVSVQLEAGGGMRTVLDGVPLHGAGQAALPPTLRLGFAGATGAHVNVHEIDSLSVRQPADLRVEHDLPRVAAGEHVRYSVTASNVGRNASDPSPLTVDVPDALHDVTWACAASDGGACSAADGTGDVGVDLALDRGASATVTIEGTLDPGATGELVSVATIAPAPHLADADETDNTSRATAVVTASAQLETDKSVEPATGVRPGDHVEYQVVARNRGPATARDVSVVDDLPAALVFVDSADACAAAGQRVTCGDGTDLAPGEERAFRFRALLGEDYRGDGSDVVNVATAASPTDPDGGDPSPGVAIEVVDPDAPGDATVPPGPSAPAASVPERSTAPAADRGGTSNPRGGALAYTGTDDLGIVAAIGGVLVAAGAGCWWVARRRLRADRHEDPAGD
ncbi:conserved repeat domain-containing protein [Curtobacterium sp. 9128]|uniref:hypothetical protein n=1 Tax=Curtobacterium sp. 9128 TaxID=1793722 RepID=UPI0007D72ABA|nr:hypothetical protein [Curtobacterium sp. 9128]SBN62060.1 conserved repeat domain-containing protein [Curtobacterium sp. 9128]